LNTLTLPNDTLDPRCTYVDLESDSAYFQQVLCELYTPKYRYTHERQLFGSWFRNKLKSKNYYLNFELVNIDNLREDHRCGHSYHNTKIFKGQTYYDHIGDHVYGSNHEDRERISNFAEFGSVSSFIFHAHQVLEIKDLNRFMDSQCDHIYLRFDFKENTLYVVSKNHLLTAYKPSSMTYQLYKLFLKTHKV
jgi:hypothetical protein